MVRALFSKRKEIDIIEELVLSVVLSFSIAGIIGIFLGLTNIELNLTSVTVSLTMITLLLAFIATEIHG